MVVVKGADVCLERMCPIRSSTYSWETKRITFPQLPWALILKQVRSYCQLQEKQFSPDASCLVLMYHAAAVRWDYVWLVHIICPEILPAAAASSTASGAKNRMTDDICRYYSISKTCVMTIYRACTITIPFVYSLVLSFPAYAHSTLCTDIV